MRDVIIDPAEEANSIYSTWPYNMIEPPIIQLAYMENWLDANGWMFSDEVKEELRFLAGN